jgi:hypothetical protein
MLSQMSSTPLFAHGRPPPFELIRELSRSLSEYLTVNDPAAASQPSWVSPVIYVGLNVRALYHGRQLRRILHGFTGGAEVRGVDV